MIDFEAGPSPRANRIIGWGVSVVLVVCIACLGWGAYLRYADFKAHLSAPIISKPVPAAAAAEVKDVPMVGITPAAPVKVYAPAAKEKLKLPKEVQDDKSKYVLAASRVAPDDHPHTITTVIDQQTGESQTYDTREPLPWLAVDMHGEAGLLYGVKNGYPAVRFEARQNLLDVKAVKIGIEATADQPTTGPLRADYFIGVGAWYQW